MSNKIIVNEDSFKQILELYKSGKTLKEISELFGYKSISTTISNFIRYKGISRMGGFQKGHPAYLDQKGEKNNRWKGGKIIDKIEGYRHLRIGNKYVREHHYVWIKHNQIPFPKGFVIHHRDCNRLNNDIKNLCLLPNDFHAKLHWEFEKQNGINRFNGEV